MWDLSHSTKAAGLAEVYFAGRPRSRSGSRFVILIALLLRLAAHRAIARMTSSAAKEDPEGSDRAHSLLFRERRQQRATALGAILSNAASLTIFGIAVVMILGDMGLNLAPVLASAGVLGVAIGLRRAEPGAGLPGRDLHLLEDQYGVGDVIDVGGTSGTVEAVSLRITRLRDVERRRLAHPQRRRSARSATSPRAGPGPWSTSPCLTATTSRRYAR